MTRGEVYYIKNPKLENGCAKLPDRPAVIVSNDMLNALNSFVKVCYMTVKPVNDMPTHVTTRCTGCVSTIMCESLDNIHISTIGVKAGELTEDEMLALDAALAISLGLDFGNMEPKVVEKPVEKIVMREPTREELDALVNKRLTEITEDEMTLILHNGEKYDRNATKESDEDVLKRIEAETMYNIAREENIKLEAERNTYRDLYHNIINKLLSDA